jgi:transposase InsO family protein
VRRREGRDIRGVDERRPVGFGHANRDEPAARLDLGECRCRGTMIQGLVHHSDAGSPRNRDAVEMATLEWVDWYNNRRLFEALGDIPPAEAESAYYATMTPSESPRRAEQTLH